MTQYACIIGNPARHSLSPVIHNAGYKALGLDWEYSWQEFEINEFESGVRGLIEQGFSGANVTMPFKLDAFEIADSVEGLANKIKAVNTLVFEDGFIKGYNTDADGFAMSLVQNKISIPELKVLVLGAGGASKAICSSLVSRGANVLVAARKIEQSKVVAEISRDPSGGCIDVVDFENRNDALNSVELLVNATPIGMKTDGEESLETPIDVSFLSPEQIVVDTIYHPLETQLVKQAKQKGCRTFNGTEMLLYQAIIAFNLMTKKEAPIEVMRKALLSAM